MLASALLPLFLVTANPTPSEALPSSATLPFSPARPVVQDEEPEQGWSGSVSAGGIIRTGNNKTRTGNATADATWRRNKNRVALGGLWSYQDDNRVVTQRKLYGQGKYDRFLSEKTFAYGQTSGDSDKEAGLDLRMTLGAGAGRQFLDDETWTFSGEAGLSGVSEDFQTSGKNEYLAARIAYDLKYAHSDTWAFAQDFQIYPSLESGDDVYLRLATTAVMTITESMFAQLQWVMDYDNTPDTGKERTDHLISLTIGWGF